MKNRVKMMITLIDSSSVIDIFFDAVFSKRELRYETSYHINLEIIRAREPCYNLIVVITGSTTPFRTGRQFKKFVR